VHETPHFGERRKTAKKCFKCGKMVSEKDDETHFKTCKLPELSSDTRFMTPKSDQKPIVIPSKEPP
jgi:hypothetical protein